MSDEKGADDQPRLGFPTLEAAVAAQGSEYRAFGLTDTFDAFPAMIEVRFRTGDRSAFAYHTLGRAEFNPSSGIVLAFLDLVVTLTGRSLDSLFTAIRQQQAVWVCEADRGTAVLVPMSVPVVESVRVESSRGR